MKQKQNSSSEAGIIPSSHTCTKRNGIVAVLVIVLCSLETSAQ
jgi:hypothetical protein